MLQLFNTITQKKEVFVPDDPSDVRFYCCGVTPYAPCHLGHCRTYIYADLLFRVLKFFLGYSVRYLMNITDLEDKILKKGGLPVARQYEQEFFDTMALLHVQRPTIVARVSDHVTIIRNLTQQHPLAYWDDMDQAFYFNAEKYFATQDRTFPQCHTRDAQLSLKSARDPRDFVLWKPMQWTDLDGKSHDSFASWHAECFALKAHYFGSSVDLQLGGIDLQFPHHENDLSLGRSHFKVNPWVKYCVHIGHVCIEGEKMSKSLKNFKSVQDILKEQPEMPVLALRWYFLDHSYSKPMTFKLEALQACTQRYESLLYQLQKIRQHLQKPAPLFQSFHDIITLTKFQTSLQNALLDDLNVPKALSLTENFVKELANLTLSFATLKASVEYVTDLLDKVFGLIEPTDLAQVKQNEAALLHCLQLFRTQVRIYALKAPAPILLTYCDDLRKTAKELNYIIED